MKLATNFKDYRAPTQFSRTFKALNIYFEIQGLSRRVKPVLSKNLSKVNIKNYFNSPTRGSSVENAYLRV